MSDTFEVIPQELCALRGCDAEATYLGLMGIRTGDGLGFGPLRADLDIWLCFEHATRTQNGLEQTGWTPPSLTA